MNNTSITFGRQNEVLEKLASIYAQYLIEKVRHNTSSTVHLLGVLDEKIEKELEDAEFVRGRSSYEQRPPPPPRENRPFRPPPPPLTPSPHAPFSHNKPFPSSRDGPKTTSQAFSPTSKVPRRTRRE